MPYFLYSRNLWAKFSISFMALVKLTLSVDGTDRMLEVIQV